MPGLLAICRRNPLWTLACCLWIALTLAVSVKALLDPVEHTAYPCFEAGTRCWWADKNLYSMAECGHEYRYGPAFAVLMTPLALLPTWLGGLLWYWLNIGVYFVSLLALVHWVLPGKWTPRLRAIFFMLVFLSASRMIWSGQSNALVFALVTGAAAAIANKRWWWAALLLVLPIHIKVWPLAAALLLIACWPRPLAGRFAAALAGIGLIPFFTKPFALVCDKYHAWLEMLTGPAQIRVGHEYRDAWTIWELIHSPVNPQWYMVLQLATAIATLGLCLWQRGWLALDRGTVPFSSDEQWGSPQFIHFCRMKIGKVPDLKIETVPHLSIFTSELLMFILVIWTAWQMLLGPGTERNTFGLIAPLSAWCLLTALEQKRGRVLISLAFALMTLANFGIVERWLSDFLPAAEVMHPVGVLLLVAWLLVFLFAWRQPASERYAKA
jgi:alpha-1,2-mannosyltransferase